VSALALAQALIRQESVTPAGGPVFDVLERSLLPSGFVVDRFLAGEAPDGPVENLLATRAGRGHMLAFAGHLDVVPPGPGWSVDPWSGDVRDGLLVGRGAADMKAAVAAFAAAAARVSDAAAMLIVTGDEEGPATHGTPALIKRMADRGLRPDWCIVGEPTCTDRLGDMMKLGRRGSVNVWITVPGRQGHVAYPHLADNPIGPLVRALAELDALVLDTGTPWFQPSNLEITDLDVGNPATNVIPPAARARLSIRFNDRHDGEDLARRVTAIVRRHAPAAQVTARVSGEAFLTEPGALSDMVSDAVFEVTGLTPEASTTGGTSDARFLSRLCPTIEFGLVNATMHQADEAVAAADVEALAQVYAAMLRRSAVSLVADAE